MNQSSSVRMTVFWFALIFIMGAVVTCVAFNVFVPEGARAQAFYISRAIVLAAELAFFAHLAHAKLSRAGIPSARTATRIQVQVLILFWLLIALVVALLTSGIGADKEAAANKVFVIYLIITFLFFVAVYFLYSREFEIEAVNQQLIAERRGIQQNVPRIEDIMQAVKTLAQKRGDQAVAADRVLKKLDSVRTQLQAVLVSERATDASGKDSEWNGQLERQLAQLSKACEGASGVGAEKVPEVLAQIGNEADAVQTILKRRERSLIT